MQQEIAEAPISEHAQTFGRTAWLVLGAALVGLLLYPEALLQWLYKMPVHPSTEFMIEQVMNWQNFVNETLHLNVFFDFLREKFREFQDMCF